LGHFPEKTRMTTFNSKKRKVIFSGHPGRVNVRPVSSRTSVAW
jgi:hypothetical protein